MRSLAKFLMLAAVVLLPALAQDAPASLPPALQDAIHRIVSGNPAATPVVQLPGTQAAPAAVCSVPLLELHIDHPDRFAIRTLPSPSTGVPMPQAHPPAPACDTVSR